MRAVVHMDVDAAEIGKLRHADAGVRGDIATSLTKLTRLRRAHGRHGPARKGLAPHERAAMGGAATPRRGVYAPALLKRLSELAPRATVASCDVGQHQMWWVQHWRRSQPHLTSGGLGAMGFRLPAAMGAQIAFGKAIATPGDLRERRRLDHDEHPGWRRSSATGCR